MRCYRLGLIEMLSDNLFEVVNGKDLDVFSCPKTPHHAGGWSERMRAEVIEPKAWRVPSMIEMEYLKELFLLGVGGFLLPSEIRDSSYWTLTPLPGTNNREYYTIRFGVTHRDRTRVAAKGVDPVFSDVFHHIRPVRTINI